MGSKRDVRIGREVVSGKKIYLPHMQRTQTVSIIGTQGRGKSRLLEHLIRADLRNKKPAILIDPHGELAERVVGLIPTEENELLDRIILLDANHTPFGLNLIDCREPDISRPDDDPASWAAESAVEIFRKLYRESEEFQPLLQRYLRLAVHTLVPSRRTLVDSVRLFQDVQFRQQCLQLVTDHTVHNDWRAFDQLPARDRYFQTSALQNRIDPLTRDHLTRMIVGSDTTVPFDRVLNGDALLIITLPTSRGRRLTANFIGAMLLCVLADRVFARGGRGLDRSKPPRLHLYLDEYQRFATETTAELITEGRKFNVGVTLAHQTLSQIPDGKIRSASLTAGALIVLGVIGEDAAELARTFRVHPRPEEIETIDEVDGVEPIKAISRQPVKHLLEQSHADPLVRYLVEKTLARFDSWLRAEREREQRKREYRDRTVKRSALEEARPFSASRAEPLSTQLKRGIDDLNSLLVDIMERRLDPREKPDVGKATAFEMRLIGMLSLLRHAMWLDASHDVDDRQVHKFLMAHVVAARRIAAKEEVYLAESVETYRRREADGFFKKFVEMVRRVGKADGNDYLDWLLLYDGITQLGKNPYRSPERTRELQRDELASCRANIDAAARLTTEHIIGLYFLCVKLQSDPILVTSGQERPRVRSRSIVRHQQSFQDAWNELAAKLVEPGDFVAHVKFGQRHVEMELVDPIRGEVDYDAVDELLGAGRRFGATVSEQEPVEQVAPAQFVPSIRRRPRNG